MTRRALFSRPAAFGPYTQKMVNFLTLVQRRGGLFLFAPTVLYCYVLFIEIFLLAFIVDRAIRSCEIVQSTVARGCFSMIV